MRSKLVVLTCVLGAAVAARAQEAAPGAAGDREAFRMVDAYIVSNMQESLDLDDDQFARLIPLVKSLQQTRREFTRRRLQALQRLNRELRTGRADEAEVARLVEELRRIQAEEPAAIRDAYAAVDAELSPIQQGRFRIMEVEVERRIRELLQRARRGGARRP